MHELFTACFSDILKGRQIYEDKIHRTCFTKRGVLVICLIVFTVFCIVCTVFCIVSFMYIYSYLFCLY